MSEALKFILIKKAQVKLAIKQLNQLQKLTGKNYEKELNKLLDELNNLMRIEEELTKK